MSIDQYFEGVVQDVFEAVLNSIGAVRVLSAHPLVVRYEASDWYVECLALLDDGPRYCPRIEIGPLPEMGVMERDKQVDILHTVPEGSYFRSYNLEWRYRSEDEMRKAFEKARDQIFIPFAVPLIRSPERLRSMVERRSGEINAAWKAEIDQHNAGVCRSHADEAWATKNYREFIDQMEKIAPTLLTASDRARLSFARKRC